MKTLLITTLSFLPLLNLAQGKDLFEQYFTDHTLRIDYYHSGDAKTEEITLDRIYRQGAWAGNPSSCVQPF